MKIVCAPDSFKESMSAGEAAEAMARGARSVVPDAQIDVIPVSDGGEGFLDALSAALGADLQAATTTDALGRVVAARWAIKDDLAIIEAAQANGLELIGVDERDIWESSSAGVGTLIKAALDAGARRFIIGIGGSASNDGGAGMLSALGARYLDQSGHELRPVPADLVDAVSVSLTGLDPRLAQSSFEVACDVTNPLTGPNGASAIFGPQKGAGPDDIGPLDALLAKLATIDGTAASAGEAGAGAAGGLGHALRSHLGATLRPGVGLVIDTTGLVARLVGADLVLTGEGSFDAQTASGKAPAGVIAAAGEAGVPVIVLAGRVSAGDFPGVRAAKAIIGPEVPLADALANGARNLERATAVAVGEFVGI